MFAFIFRHPIALFFALVLHAMVAAGLIWERFDVDGAMKVSLDEGEQAEITQITEIEPLKTFTVDSALVKEQLAKIKQDEAEKLAEQKRLKAQSIAEKRRLEQMKRQQRLEQQKAEQQKRIAEAEARKADEAKRLAEIERQKSLAEQKRAEAAKRASEQAKKEAELADKKRLEAQKRVAEAEAQRKAEEAKKLALQKKIEQQAAEKKRLEAEALQARLRKEQEEAERQLQQQIAAEEAKKRQLAKQRELKNLRETYVSSIAAKVKDNWRTASNVSEKAQCVLSITQTPAGKISGVTVENCNKFADKQFIKDAKNAVYRAEPMPAPPVEELFERNIKFVFKP